MVKKKRKRNLEARERESGVNKVFFFVFLFVELTAFIIQEKVSLEECLFRKGFLRLQIIFSRIQIMLHLLIILCEQILKKRIRNQQLSNYVRKILIILILFNVMLKYHLHFIDTGSTKILIEGETMDLYKFWVIKMINPNRDGYLNGYVPKKAKKGNSFSSFWDPSPQ